MVKANIVIIDSGLEHNLHVDDKIKGGVYLYKEANGKIIKQDVFDDVYGHGTALFNIIKKICKDATFYFIKIFDNKPQCDQDLLLYSLNYIYKYVECDFVLLSSGAIRLKNIKELDALAEKLYRKKIIIVSAFNNQGALSYPAASEFVIGVDSSSAVTPQESYYIIDGSPINILCHQNSYRVTWLNGNRFIDKGNSYEAASFIAKLFQAYKKIQTKDINQLLSFIKKGTNLICFERPCFDRLLNPSFLPTKKNLRAAVFPFSKEMKVLSANEELLLVDVVHYYDIPQSGKIGFAISDIVGYGDNKKRVENIDNIEFATDYDMIVCGHLGLLEQITKIDWKNRLKNIAVKNSKYIYFFDSESDRINDYIYSPPMITKYNGYTFGKLWQINSPVLGVFGTSSRQGKYSLQLKLRKAFFEKGYLLKQISTEPTGALFGMDFNCPIGYNSSIKLKSNDATKLFNQLVHECDLYNPDLIIVGCQSATLFHNNFHEQFFTFQQIEFLVGTNPDAVILVINEFDDEEYLKRTIDFIESSIDTTVIACVMSPVYKAFPEGERSLKIKCLSSLLKKPVFEYDLEFCLLFQAIIKYFGG